MAIDSSIYFKQQPLNIFGSIQDGLKLREGIDDRKFRSQLGEAQKAAIITNPDGTTSFDQNAYLGALGQMAGTNPHAAREAVNLGSTMYQQQREQEKWANTLKQQDVDNQYRRDALASSAADRAEARNERRFQFGIVRDEKVQALQTPYGLANTTDDAKQLKQAHESKANFDSKLQEMIDLRKKYGTEYFNREAVARGQQLSKDLLLEYKNMAKLGVLSKSDEDIINAIIPPDPLAQDWAPGQDPILSNLSKFKQDSDRDFQNRVNTRTRAGLAGKPNDAISTLRSKTGGGELGMSPNTKMIDVQAVKWAQQNPNDPRSAEILRVNGIGG